MVGIDAHHHVWDLARRPQPWTADMPALRRSFALGDLEPHLRANGFDATVVVQTVTVAEETPELLSLAAAEPVVAGVVGWVDLTDVDVARRLAELRALPGGDRLVSIRHQVQDEPDPRWLLRSSVMRGLCAVERAGLAYDLVVKPRQLPAVIDLARAMPGLRFVLDHLGKPAVHGGELEPWQGDIGRLATCGNVAAKMSGLVTEADHATWTVDDLRPYVRAALDHFGPSRLMFGSDWPACLVAADYDRVADAARELLGELSPGERAQVFGATASRWYALPS